MVIKPITLTPEEARVLYTLANRMWVPGFAYEPLKASLEKLLIIGGGECCRDCSSLGTTPHRLGGVVCPDHANRTPLQTFNNEVKW